MQYPEILSKSVGFSKSLSLFLLAVVLSSGFFGCQTIESGRAESPGSPKRIIIPKFNADITIDAHLNEPVWQKAAKLSLAEKTGATPGREATEVWLWYDDEALYLAWICSDSDIQATFTERDSRFWEEEVCEFFITAENLEQYFELQWNPLGGEFDAIIDNKLDDSGISHGIEGHWEFTAKSMKSAVEVEGSVSDATDTDVKWQVEVMVPFSDLNVSTPQAGDTWRGNFYRFNRGTGYDAEGLAWSPVTLPSFHQPSRFGYLVFGD
ncbi:MAG: carbohydrate-binding family 9-like protein [Verrucomicrobia bacterium]|nr:carbohydrate-binding family 9-like protein [Verrucomicrobiota bacterium]